MAYPLHDCISTLSHPVLVLCKAVLTNTRNSVLESTNSSITGGLPSFQTSRFDLFSLFDKGSLDR